ncbi:hypothetical protein ACODG7_15590 [Vibrio anguillarum]|uniref:hypothetical protein n=1 Tax=Vibrio anguillarum TaxID=55601 RepID=UPI0002E42509|nr:hypothetical protein [Vibrio anguillarum]OEE32799.1 hypothetical protein A1QW_02100 [Vibrio anguillarum]
MHINTFRLAEHYTDIQHFITDDGEDINKLYEKHGERITECLFLSHLAESLESNFCHESLHTIASGLIEFELTKFQPPELIPIYNGPKLFKGEIVYFSYNALVAKITSYQFPTWQILLTVVERTTYSILPNFKSKADIELSAVSL